MFLMMGSEPQDTKSKVYILETSNQRSFILILLETAQFDPQFLDKCHKGSFQTPLFL